MTDAHRAPHPLLIARVLPKGAAIILREYDNPRRGALAAQLKAVCVARGLKLIIGADVELACKLNADGVHLPRWLRHANIMPKDMIVTAACHDASEFNRAKQAGANLAFLSPAFPTHSHKGAPALGAERFRKLANASPLPVLALGGVDETNALKLSGQNTVGLAAIGAFLK